MALYTVTLQSGRTTSVNADTPRQAEDEAQRRNPNDSVVSVNPAAAGGPGYDPFGGVFGTPSPQFISPAATAPDLPFYLQPSAGDIGTARDTSGMSSMFVTPKPLTPELLALRKEGEGEDGKGKMTKKEEGDGAGDGTGDGTGDGAGEEFVTPISRFVPEDLGDRDWMSAFRAALGTAARPISDPYRQYQEQSMWDFFRPYQYQNVLSGVPDVGTSAPGFQQYLTNIGGNLGQARQNAANVFNQLVGGGGGADIQNLLGATVATQSPWGELDRETAQRTLNEIAALGQSGMRGRLGSAAYDVLGRFAPSAEDVYRDYFQRSRAGMDVAPTFGQALQTAYGLG